MPAGARIIRYGVHPYYGSSQRLDNLCFLPLAFTAPVFEACLSDRPLVTEYCVPTGSYLNEAYILCPTKSGVPITSNRPFDTV